MKKIRIIALLIIAFTIQSKAQTAPFQVAIDPLNITNLGGLQSYAWGQDDGKWLIIGGRLDGLHQRQPFAAFDLAGHNNQLIVVDPITQQKWSAPLSSLPNSMQEQLSSTNMEFIQEGDYLYLLGGYGFSTSAGDHITYPNLTAVNVPEVIEAIINSTSFSTNFRQINDTMFAVTGGYLNKINNTFYLTGGQKFMGRYNPMGPSHGPGFVQQYTNAIRRFKIIDDGTTVNITHLPTWIDATNLHRRDYNVIPQILPTGEEGLTAFSGVFQQNVDLPFLNCVNIDSSGYAVNNTFSQYYNHYHCAHIPLYSATTNEMHNVFFGGIAQYYDNEGTLVQDDDVPFVNTIARVTRDANGVMSEYKLPIEMPSLLGAGSEFIAVETLAKYPNEVIKLDDITSDTTLVGYIYGGISSSFDNIFFINDGSQSNASSQIFKVYLIKNAPVGIHELNESSISTLRLQIYPNPTQGDFKVKFYLQEASDVKIKIQDTSGKLLDTIYLQDLPIGENTFSKKLSDQVHNGFHFITFETSYETAVQKVIFSR